MQHKLQGLVVMGLQQAQKMSLAAKVLSGIIVFFYLLSFAPRVEENLAMIPAYIVPPNVKIWTLVTATLFERRIIFAILDIIAIVGFSLVLEPLWGVKEFLIFTSIVGVSSLASGVLAAVAVYAITQNYSYMFVPFHGLVAFACGCVVAVKQFHPDSVAFPPPAPPTLRVKHLSLVIIITAIILAFCKVVSYAFVWLAISGTFVSWIYLRFYQKKDQGSRGDMSEGFAFATFFPDAIQPPLATLGGFIYYLLVSIKLCPKAVRTYDVGAPSTIKLTLPGTDPVDAQRRKQRALKALDERLNKSGEPISWPSLDDAGSSSQDEQQALTSSATHKDTGSLEAVVVEKLPATVSVPAPGNSGLSKEKRVSSSSSLHAKTDTTSSSSVKTESV